MSERTMVNLLTSLVDRALDRAPVLQRRQRSVFEPVKPEPPIGHDNSTDLPHEDQIFAESKKSVANRPIAVVDRETVAEPESNPVEQHTTKRPAVRPIETIEVAPQRQHRPADPPKVDPQDLSTIRVAEVNPKTPRSVEPSTHTIVEKKIEREVVVVNQAEQPPVEQLTVVEHQSTTNNILAQPPNTRKQTPLPVDQPVSIKPVEPRRATRQETQRSVHTRLKTEQPPRAESAAPTINVTIGRVEIRATTPTKRADTTRRPGPKLSLDDYLQGRGKGN